MSNPRQIRALLELVAHLSQGEDERRDAPRVLSPDEDLPAELVRLHHLAPLAFKAGYGTFREDYARNALRAELRSKLVADAVEVLTRANVPVILLKGVSYVGVIYDDPAERPMDDIDLLVKPDDFARARDALGELGFAPHTKRVQQAPTHHAQTLVYRDTPLDLHRSMIQPLRSRIDLDAIWARALPAIEREDQALRLDPVDEAVLHLIHVARHELMVPAIAYVEARKLIERRGCDRERVAARAGEFRLGRAVSAALAMTDALIAGSDRVEWPDRGLSIMPGVGEVLAREHPSRARQVVRKAALVEGPRELAGLFAIGVLERLRSR